LIDKPLISAIISTYNSEKFIEGRIIDLLEQTISTKLEIIIVNSGSKEDEDSIIKKYQSKNSNIYYIKTEERESIYRAWNRALMESRGEFITNANTDDRLRKDALEILSNNLQVHPDIALVYADQVVSNIPNLRFHELYKITRKKVHTCPEYNYFNQLDRCLVFSQPMWRSIIHFHDNIWFDEKYEISGDYDFYLRITQKYKMLHINETLGIFYLSPQRDNKSHKEMDKVILERNDISEKYIYEFINSTPINELVEIKNRLVFYTRIPIPLFYIWKRIRLLISPSLIQNKFFHSIEFVYFFSILVLEKQRKLRYAIKLSRRLLRYYDSKRVGNRLKLLLVK
jgi:glycosyltransferase involved in cell wall biosynthesis